MPSAASSKKPGSSPTSSRWAGQPTTTFAEFVEYFAICWLATTSVLVARVARRLSTDPVEPLDLEALRVWRARRRWLIAAELAALPALTMVAVLCTYWSGPDYLIALSAGLIAGALGFPFLVHAVETLVRRKISIDAPFDRERDG